MSNQLILNNNILNNVSADCENCFGLCCVALPFAKSADFAFDKAGGNPCNNLRSDYRCHIHKDLRKKGLRGCTVYECFGAGQKVSQVTYKGNDWREHPESAKEMFAVFPIMQQLHEMLLYLNEALNLEEARPIHQDLQKAFEETEQLTNINPKSILELNVPGHRATVNELLLKTSELVRAQVKTDCKQGKQKKLNRGSDFIGAKLRGANLRGANLRGALLIASDLRDADMRWADMIGADLRDADLRGPIYWEAFFLRKHK